MKVNIEIDCEEIEELAWKISYILSLKKEGQELIAGYELSKLESLIQKFYNKVVYERRKSDLECGRRI